MNRNIWQGKYRQARGDLKRGWGKFTNNDRQRLEGELDRVLGMAQQRYGYTRARAVSEIEHYVGRYGKQAKATVNETVDQLRGRKSTAASWSFPWGWLAMGLVGVSVYLGRQWWEQQQDDKDPAQREKVKEAIRRERERDDVDERSWESFPASDPPASW